MPGNSEGAEGCSNDGSSYCNVMGGRCYEECPEEYDFGVNCVGLCGRGLYRRCTCCYSQEGKPCGENEIGICKGNCSVDEIPESGCLYGRKCCVKIQQDDSCDRCVARPEFCEDIDLEYFGLCEGGGYCCQNLTARYGDGWTTFESSIYQYFNIGSTYFEATDDCMNRSGYLASVGSEAENSFLAELVDVSAYIGLNDIDSENDFVWQDGSSLNFSSWIEETNEPNNAGGNEDCVQLFPSTFWNDINCNLRLHYICEIPFQ